MARIQPGDHLAVRTHYGFEHHGIAAEDGYVYANDGRYGNPGFKAVPMDEFLRGSDPSTLRVVPGALYSNDEVLSRAEQIAEHDDGRYRPLSKNCEHAAYLASQDRRESPQVTGALDSAAFLFGGPLGVVASRAVRRFWGMS